MALSRILRESAGLSPRGAGRSELQASALVIGRELTMAEKEVARLLVCASSGQPWGRPPGPQATVPGRPDSPLHFLAFRDHAQAKESS